MARLHLNKRGLRVLGVAESFAPGDARSVLGGVVMRGDLIVDGVAFGHARVGGDDATDQVVRLWRALRRNDVNLTMLSGCIISKYNIVDPDALSRRLGMPVVCLTYNETRGIAGSIRKNFPGDRDKIEAYRRLGPRRSVRLSSGHRVFLRDSGISDEDASSVVDMFTLQGSVPEPVRVAKLLARAATKRSSRRGSSGTSGRRSV